MACPRGIMNDPGHSGAVARLAAPLHTAHGAAARRATRRAWRPDRSPAGQGVDDIQDLAGLM